MCEWIIGQTLSSTVTPARSLASCTRVLVPANCRVFTLRSNNSSISSYVLPATSGTVKKIAIQPNKPKPKNRYPAC